MIGEIYKDGQVIENSTFRFPSLSMDNPEAREMIYTTELHIRNLLRAGYAILQTIQNDNSRITILYNPDKWESHVIAEVLSDEIQQEYSNEDPDKWEEDTKQE